LFHILFLFSWTAFVIHVLFVINLKSSNSYPIDKVLSDQTHISNPFRTNVNAYFTDSVQTFCIFQYFIDYQTISAR